VLSTGPFRAIREAHPNAHIVLLTIKAYEGLARRTGYFDEIWLDERPKPWQVSKLLALRRLLRSKRFSWVYDLQTSDRSSSYYRLFGRPKPAWSGIATGCSHPHANPNRNFMHTVERQADQLAMAGIQNVPPPDLSMIDSDLTPFDLPERFALLVPGSSPHRPDKRWPAAHYGELARRLESIGLKPVLIGAEAERETMAEILRHCPSALNLAGRTSFDQIAALGRKAQIAVGNDTGPMHILATAGCRSVVLFSKASDPALTAPRGRDVTVLQRGDLADLSVDEVAAVTPAAA